MTERERKHLVDKFNRFTQNAKSADLGERYAMRQEEPVKTNKELGAAWLTRLEDLKEEEEQTEKSELAASMLELSKSQRVVAPSRPLAIREEPTEDDMSSRDGRRVGPYQPQPNQFGVNTASPPAGISEENPRERKTSSINFNEDSDLEEDEIDDD